MKNISVEDLRVPTKIRKVLLNAGIKNTEILVKRTLLEGLTSIEGMDLPKAQRLENCLVKEKIRWCLTAYELFVLDVCFEKDRQRRVYARKFLDTPLNNSQIVMIEEFFEEMDETNSKHPQILRDYYGLGIDGQKKDVREMARIYNVSTERIRQLINHAVRHFQHRVIIASNLEGLDDYQVLLGAHLTKEQERQRRYCIAPPRKLDGCLKCKYSHSCEAYLARSQEPSSIKITENSPLICLDLPRQSCTALNRVGVESISDILAIDLKNVRNLGGKRISEIEGKLRTYGFIV